MPLPQLDNLVKTGQLKSEPPAQAELDGLARSGAARITDAENQALALESRFDLAYNAGHAFALAALRFHGYRSENRFLVFQTLAHTIGLAAEKWRVLDRAHRKRNLVEYEGEVELDNALIDAMIRVVREVEAAVRKLGPVRAPRTR